MARREETGLDRELADLPPDLRWREWMRRIEAVLFASGTPVAREDLARVVGQVASVDLLIEDLAVDLEGRPYEVSRLPRLQTMIDKTLRGQIVARDALKDRDKVKKREREFRFPTHITFDNEGSDIYTIIEVDTRDRPGLLYDLTRTLAGNNIYIASAVIATFGAQVVDSFYVKDMFGLKLHAKSKQEALEKKLRQAITEGAERAQGQG